MTLTKRLRILLKANKIDWVTYKGVEEILTNVDYAKCSFEEIDDGRSLRCVQYFKNAEHALAVVLLRGECHVECFDDGVDEALDGSVDYLGARWFLSCGHEVEGSERPKFCPECGKMVVDDYE